MAARNALASFRFLNFRCTEMEAGRAVILIDPIAPGQRGGAGSDAVNGGVLGALMDFTMGASVDSLYVGVPADRHRTGTVDLQVTFVSPCYGEVCRGEAVVVGGGRQVLFARGQVLDSQGRVCAHALGTFRVWAGGPRVHALPGEGPVGYLPLRGEG